MNSFLLDKNNNIITGGNFYITSGDKTIEQDSLSMLNMSVKEYAFNTLQGIDWLDYFQTKNSDKLLDDIQTRLLQDPRILKVIFKWDTSKNKSFTINITTINNTEVNLELK